MRRAAENSVQPNRLVILSEAKNLFGCFASLNMTDYVKIGNAMTNILRRCCRPITTNKNSI